MEISGILAMVGVGIASVTDCRRRKVPNWLTASLGLLGLGISIGEHGASGLLQALAAAGIALVLFLFPFSRGWIGGGDVKLLMSLGLLLGTRRLFWISLYTALAGGVAAVILIIWHQVRASEFRDQIRVGFLSALFWLAKPHGSKQKIGPMALPATRHALSSKFPYALAIAAGTIITLLTQPG